MVDFAGWAMPVQYESIVTEHHATRQAAGLFDVSHMGRFRFDGAGSAALLDGIVTRRVADLRPGQIRYALVTNAQGGVLDDVLVYCLEDPDGTPFHWMVVNASNREKIIRWIQPHLSGSDDVQLTDCTTETAMIAIQGPLAHQLAGSLGVVDSASWKYYTGRLVEVVGHRAIVSRTGYTGEDGVELIVPSEGAEEIWQALIDKGSADGVRAAGLGARDTLRLEAAMPLYGHELTEGNNPFQAGLKFAVNLQGRQFIGSDALRELSQDAAQPRRIGLMLSGRRAARQHYAVLSAGSQVGEVTSGTFSPTLEQPIAMAYVAPEHSEPGGELEVDVRGTVVKARVVKLPFYTRPSPTT